MTRKLWTPASLGPPLRVCRECGGILEGKAGGSWWECRGCGRRVLN